MKAHQLHRSGSQVGLLHLNFRGPSRAVGDRVAPGAIDVRRPMAGHHAAFSASTVSLGSSPPAQPPLSVQLPGFVPLCCTALCQLHGAAPATDPDCFMPVPNRHEASRDVRHASILTMSCAMHRHHVSMMRARDGAAEPTSLNPRAVSLRRDLQYRMDLLQQEMTYIFRGSPEKCQVCARAQPAAMQKGGSLKHNAKVAGMLVQKYTTENSVCQCSATAAPRISGRCHLPSSRSQKSKDDGHHSSTCVCRPSMLHVAREVVHPPSWAMRSLVALMLADEGSQRRPESRLHMQVYWSA